MEVSVFDLFSIGIGPSSSHTVGPMRAVHLFLLDLQKNGFFQKVKKVKTDLYGSLALTGHGHKTDKAIVLGLLGLTPEGVDPDQINALLGKVEATHALMLDGKEPIEFKEETDLLFHKDKFLPFHPNGLRFTAYDAADKELSSKVYYSVGGGFVLEHDKIKSEGKEVESSVVPFPFKTGQELLDQCEKQKVSIPELIRLNERVWRKDEEIDKGLLNIWSVMSKCIDRGCHEKGILPGGLGVKRRAAPLFEQLKNEVNTSKEDPTLILDWVSLFALAVNEENAAGGRVVTAPTNGAAGVVPAVLRYYKQFVPQASEKGIINFLLTAGGIGKLYKLGASISAAEMGCMGEVGVACSMAAAGLTAALGGSNLQIENAAEIGMEHHLGLTCDPVMGLVQIPCIERNTMGAIEAINAARLSLRGDGTHRVSLDQVIATMRETGKNMKSIYKETSLGGLAANVPEC